MMGMRRFQRTIEERLALYTPRRCIGAQTEQVRWRTVEVERAAIYDLALEQACTIPRR